MHQEYEPPQELKNVIKCFWYDKKNFGGSQASFEVVPDGYAEIIFYFGELYSPLYNDGLQLLPSPFMMGLLNQPARFYTKQYLEIIGIRCFPWVVFDLLQLRACKGGVQTFEHPVAALQPTLSEYIRKDRTEEAIAVVASYFAEAYSQMRTDSLLSKAGSVMREANGKLPVGKVATAAHATVRTLERKFRQSSGHTAKDVSGLMRFEQVRNQLWLNPGINLAGLAVEMGYSDQAHLSKEFRKYSGNTPAAFARKTKRSKPMLGDDFVAFIQG